MSSLTNTNPTYDIPSLPTIPVLNIEATSVISLVLMVQSFVARTYTRMYLRKYMTWDLGFLVWKIFFFSEGWGLVKGTILFVFSKVILTMFEIRKRTEHLEDRCST